MKLLRHIPLQSNLEKNSNKKENNNLNVFAHVMMMTQFHPNLGGYVQPLHLSKFCHNTHLKPSSFYGKSWVQRPYKRDKSIQTYFYNDPNCSQATNSSPSIFVNMYT
jgi:hypothetical protein